MGDLIGAMGLSRSSFYAAFGSKRWVLLDAVQLYSRHCLELLADIARSDAGQRSKLQDMIRGLAMVGEDRACFMANCISERGRRDPDVRRLAAAHNEAIEWVFTQALRAVLSANGYCALAL